MKPLAIALAVVFFVVAFLYLFGILQIAVTHPGGHHVSHFVLFSVLGALALIWLRFQSRSATPPGAR
jgi:hypothetical protein